MKPKLKANVTKHRCIYTFRRRLIRVKALGVQRSWEASAYASEMWLHEAPEHLYRQLPARY